ncbi:glycosyltransferase [Siccirubricoccus deserti]
MQAAAAGAPNIEFRGHVAQAELVALTQSARAFVFAAEEDFGIGLVEAQACGTPLIAYGRGGARDIVLPDTGVLFGAQSAEAIIAAVDAFEAGPPISPEACRANALRFSGEHFRAAMRAHVDTLLAEREHEIQPRRRHPRPRPRAGGAVRQPAGAAAQRCRGDRRRPEPG